MLKNRPKRELVFGMDERKITVQLCKKRKIFNILICNLMLVDIFPFISKK